MHGLLLTTDIDVCLILTCKKHLITILQVCLIIFHIYDIPLETFSLNMQTSSLQIKGFKFRPVQTMSNEGSNQNSLACHNFCDMGPPFLRSRLKGLITLTRTTGCLAVEFLLHVLMTQVCHNQDWNHDFPHVNAKTTTEPLLRSPNTYHKIVPFNKL